MLGNGEDGYDEIKMKHGKISAVFRLKHLQLFYLN